MHDTFISYATEDNDFASDLAFGLKANGLSVWYAPLSLKVGDKLLDSIELGLNESRTGILIISREYLSKNWTSYEMDILVRQHIEGDKKLLPIWYGVTKKEIEKKHAGLSGIVAVTDTDDIAKIISQLLEALSDGAPSRGVIPSWENAEYRFLNGLGEALLQNSDGPATTIYEFLIHSKDNAYPFWLAGKAYTKKELLFNVAMIMGPAPERIRRWVQEDGFSKLWDMCIENDINPNDYY